MGYWVHRYRKIPDTSHPGIGKQRFKVTLSPKEFSKGDVLNMGNKNTQVKVVKVYKYNWWRKLLVWFGYPKVKLFTGIKVETTEDGKK